MSAPRRCCGRACVWVRYHKTGNVIQVCRRMLARYPDEFTRVRRGVS